VVNRNSAGDIASLAGKVILGDTTDFSPAIRLA